MVFEMLVLGFDIFFVLVFDLECGRSVVIGDCLFYYLVDIVIVLVEVYISGMYDVGMVVIVKYFLGYGWVEVDLYVVIFLDECDELEIDVFDMILFKWFCGVYDVVMLVYVIYFRVDF